MVAVAIKAGAVKQLLCSHAVSREAETASRASLAFSVLPILLTTDDAREDFSTANGVEILADALDRWAGVMCWHCFTGSCGPLEECLLGGRTWINH